MHIGHQICGIPVTRNFIQFKYNILKLAGVEIHEKSQWQIESAIFKGESRRYFAVAVHVWERDSNIGFRKEQR